MLLQYILCIHPFRSPVAPATAVHWPNLRRRGRPRCRCAAEASRCPAMGGSPWRPSYPWEIHGENHGKTMGKPWDNHGRFDVDVDVYGEKYMETMGNIRNI